MTHPRDQPEDSGIPAPQHYTPALLAQLVGVSVGKIRLWHRRELIDSVSVIHRVPYFDMGAVLVARRLKELTAAGVKLGDIARIVAELKHRAPDVARPLLDLPLKVEGKQLLLWHDDELVELSGQRRLTFTDTSAAQVAVLPLAARDSGSVEEMLAEAAELEETGDLKLAADLYRVVLASGGPRADVCFLLAEVLYRLGDLAAARERYFMAIELDENYVEARANLGCLFAEIGQRDLALAALAGALAHHPDYADAHYHLARLLDDEERPAQARTHWQRFLELSPGNPWCEEALARLDQS